MGSLKLTEGYYVTLRDPCLPLSWFSPSLLVRIEGPGSIFIGGFDLLRDQTLPIHLANFRPGSGSGPGIRREKKHDNIILTETRTSPPQSENRVVAATDADIGVITSTVFSSFEGFTFFGDSDPVFFAELELRILGATPGSGGTWQHKLEFVETDTVRLFEFFTTVFNPETGMNEKVLTPMSLRDARFLTFNTLTNGVDFTNSVISSPQKFCEKKLSPALVNAIPKNELIVNASSIPKEINTALDPKELNLIKNQISLRLADENTPNTTAMDFDLIMKEYWLLEPAPDSLIAAFDDTTPNNALFDDILSMANIVETEPGLDVTVFGCLRSSTGTLNSFSLSMDLFVFGIASDFVASLTHQEGLDYKESTNVIQFSKDERLFAGNGGANLVGF